MKFTLSSTALSSSLSSLARVINSKNSLAILDCILFQIHDGQLILTASDSDNTMKATLPLDECDGEADICIPSRTILESMKELPEQPLTFEINTADYSISVLYQNGVYHFTGVDAQDYPQPQPLSDICTIVTMDSLVLLNNINRSLFATAQEELHPVMNGIYFDMTEECISIVSTDGKKLVRNKNFTVKVELPVSFILPKKPATLLKNVLTKDGGEVVVKFDNRSAVFSFSGGVLICRLLEGRYPKYNSVIPKSNPNQLTVDRRSLLSALRRVLPFASESSQLVRLRTELGKLEVSSEDIDFATSAKESITCEYVGVPMSIGFKGSNLTEILSNLESDEVVIELADPSRAGVVVPAVQPENEEVLMLIMPVLLND